MVLHPWCDVPSIDTYMTWLFDVDTRSEGPTQRHDTALPTSSGSRQVDMCSSRSFRKTTRSEIATASRHAAASAAPGMSEWNSPAGSTSDCHANCTTAADCGSWYVAFGTAALVGAFEFIDE